MKSSHFVIVGFMLLFTFGLFSCGNRQHENNGEKLEKISDKDLMDSLIQLTDAPFEHFYSRISVDLVNSQESTSFKTSLKMRVDSAFSGTVSLAGIIGATYLVSQDSAMYTDKLKKCYRAEDLSYLSGIFGTEIDYLFFQGLILGQPIGVDPKVNYKQISDDHHYILSSHKIKDFKRYDDKPEKADEDEILIKYFINPRSFDLDKMFISVPADTVDIRINYIERKIEEGFDFSFPEETEILIYTPRDTTEINLNYGSIKLNTPREVDITIPDSYNECE